MDPERMLLRTAGTHNGSPHNPLLRRARVEQVMYGNDSADAAMRALLDPETRSDAEDDLGPGAGRLVAKFTTFGVEDSYGDIIVKGALDDFEGSQVQMVWHHHPWEPIGLGTLKTQADYALWDGQFWMDTDDGKQAYLKVKNLGAVQEYSWGFMIREAEPREDDGDKDPSDMFWWYGGLNITKAEPVEVSPVMRGANPETGTVSLRSAVPFGTAVAYAPSDVSFTIGRTKSGLPLYVPRGVEPADAVLSFVDRFEAITERAFTDAEHEEFERHMKAMQETLERAEAIRAKQRGLRRVSKADHDLMQRRYAIAQSRLAAIEV